MRRPDGLRVFGRVRPYFGQVEVFPEWDCAMVVHVGPQHVADYLRNRQAEPGGNLLHACNGVVVVGAALGEAFNGRGVKCGAGHRFKLG
jgi:hypothetical protein